MNNIKITSFKITEENIQLFKDKEGKDCAVIIPKWMLNQIVENCFNVKVTHK